MRDRLLSLLVGAALAVGSAAPAWSADYYGAEPMPEMYSEALVPTCDNPKVLAEVEDQFEHGAVEMLQTGVVIQEFSGLMEKAYFPLSEDRPIERRYCQGEALISDGQQRTVYYTVSYPMGYASIGWKAEGCVLGLDKWLIYGANCQSLRRF
jgi:hypothetical protein